MRTETATIGQTPCCGTIERTWTCYPDPESETGYTHEPGSAYFYSTNSYEDTTRGPYTPIFIQQALMIDRGICPDCGKSFHQEDPYDNGLRPDNTGEEDVPNEYTNGPDGQYHSMSCRCYSCQMNDG